MKRLDPAMDIAQLAERGSWIHSPLERAPDNLTGLVFGKRWPLRGNNTRPARLSRMKLPC